MPDMEKVIKGLRDIDGFIAGQVRFDQAKNFMRTIDEAVVLLKEQQNQIWELQDQVEYLTDKQKEQEKKGKNRLPYSSDSNVQWT